MLDKWWGCGPVDGKLIRRAQQNSSNSSRRAAGVVRWRMLTAVILKVPETQLKTAKISKSVPGFIEVHISKKQHLSMENIQNGC